MNVLITGAAGFLGSHLTEKLLLENHSVIGIDDLSTGSMANLEKFKEGNVPLPSNWGGYIVHPTNIEFWQGRSSRLHDRIKYNLSSDGQWTKVRLAP